MVFREWAKLIGLSGDIRYFGTDYLVFKITYKTAIFGGFF